jgi:hypothetical protein
MSDLIDRTPHPVSLPTIHLGVPAQVAGLTIFPAWTDQPSSRRAIPTDVPDGATITELPERPAIEQLLVTNQTALSFLLLEGMLVGGGWQHRVLANSLLVGPTAELVVDVRCVENGRWQGPGGHGVDRRRAPLAVRGALRGIQHPGPFRSAAAGEARADQGDVWARVDRYQQRFGHSATSSIVDVLDRIGRQEPGAPCPKPLTGQRGVLVGVGGHPVLLELFDHPRTLAQQLSPIVEGLLLDGLRKPWVVTSGRRARTFAGVASGRVLEVVDGAGDGVLVATRNALMDVRGVADRTGRLLHASAVNVRHELVAA